jgi:hypothetical protein
MASDIELGQGAREEWTTVTGAVLKAAVSDLMIDSPGRRSDSGGHRRAMVHDYEDGLTVNWANDYPGGVRINQVSLNLKYVVQGADAELPKSATPGDLLMIFHKPADEVMLPSTSIWLCVPHDVNLSGNAVWQQISLAEPVEGTA